VRTTAARKWGAEVFKQIDKYREEIISFRGLFNPLEHCLHFELIFYYPIKLFYNKQNSVSAKTMDLSNVEKPLIDLLTQEKYADRPFPDGAENFRIDDRFITSLYSRKKPSKCGSGHSITIIVRIMPLEAK